VKKKKLASFPKCPAVASIDNAYVSYPAVNFRKAVITLQDLDNSRKSLKICGQSAPVTEAGAGPSLHTFRKLLF
jgi:hypothetical protein